MSARDIKIKTGVVKRLAKEISMYKREAEEQEGRIDKLKAKGADDADIRKQKEVLQETLVMIPDCQTRFARAYSELKELTTKSQDAQSEEVKAALAVLDETQNAAQ
ncbi:hypothetical protein RI367_001944 [Sorochytrium milnesiophthora]